MLPLYTDMISCLKSQTGTVLSIKDVLYQERLLSNVKNVLCLMSHRRFSMNRAKDFRISKAFLLHQKASADTNKKVSRRHK